VRVPGVVRAHLEWSEIPAAVFLVDFFSQRGTFGSAPPNPAAFGGGNRTPKDLTASTHGVALTSVNPGIP
jgi:hypothetical protein